MENTNTNKFHVLCRRSAGSVLGPATALLRNNGTLMEFATWEQAHEVARKLNLTVRSGNLSYCVNEPRPH